MQIFSKSHLHILFAYVYSILEYLNTGQCPVSRDKNKKSPIIAMLIKITKIWSHDRDLNPRPLPYHGSALPTELSRHRNIIPNASRLSYNILFFKI